MNRKLPILLSCLIGLQGCTAMQDFLSPLQTEAPPVAEVTPLEERPRVEPQDPNIFVLASPEQAVVGEPQLVFASEENTFSLLAREYGLGYDELVAANPGVDPWLPGEGTPVLLPTQYVLPDVPREGVVLNIAAKRLFYFPAAEDGESQKVMTYPIGIGRVGWETPLGHSAVVSKATDPHWWVPASVREEHAENGDPLPSVVPPGPDNPLGRHVLKLDIPGYLIHGTNQPYGVGMRVSHGCVRLYPENIEVLYDLVGIGEPVVIVNEPYLVGKINGEVYFEAHPPLEDDPISRETRLADVLALVEIGQGAAVTQAELDLLKATAAAALGIPARMTTLADDELTARARVVHNTVTPDPDMPTLAEVREILDAPLEQEEPGEAAVSGSNSGALTESESGISVDE